MKIIIKTYIILALGILCACNTEISETNISEIKEETNATVQQQLPHYSVNLAEVDFAYPLEDLRFYDQILEIHNNHINTLKASNFDPDNVLVLIDGNDSVTMIESIRDYLLHDQHYLNWDNKIMVHFLVKHLRNNNFGTLSMNVMVIFHLVFIVAVIQIEMLFLMTQLFQ